MKTTYRVDGMTCMHCLTTVKEAIGSVSGVTTVDVKLDDGLVRVDADNVSLDELREALALHPKYSIHEQGADTNSNPAERSQLQKLYPLFLVFAFLIGAVAIDQLLSPSWDTTRAMLNFMGGFFVVFSFFKFLDLQGFVDAFRTYDPIAQYVKPYAWLYPFIELGLGIAMFLPIDLTPVFVITIILLGATTAAVLRILIDRRTIQCACLGTVFDLPMTKVTLIENSLMIAMAAWMLFSRVFA